MECYNKLVQHSNTLNSLIRKTMMIIKLGTKLNMIEKAKTNKSRITKQVLVREAWRLILLSSQKNYPFKQLEQYNMVNLHGIKCKHTTSVPMAITLLGTDRTPILSDKDPLSKLLLRKAHVRDTYETLKNIHSSTSATLSKLMTGKFGILLVNGEDQVKNYIRPVSYTHLTLPTNREV